MIAVCRSRGQRPRLQVQGWMNDFVAAIDDSGMRKPRSTTSLQVNGWKSDFVAAIDDRGIRKPRSTTSATDEWRYKRIIEKNLCRDLSPIRPYKTKWYVKRFCSRDRWSRGFGSRGQRPRLQMNSGIKELSEIILVRTYRHTYLQNKMVCKTIL